MINGFNGSHIEFDVLSKDVLVSTQDKVFITRHKNSNDIVFVNRDSNQKTMALIDCIRWFCQIDVEHGDRIKGEIVLMYYLDPCEFNLLTGFIGRCILNNVGFSATDGYTYDVATFDDVEHIGEVWIENVLRDEAERCSESFDGSAFFFFPQLNISVLRRSYVGNIPDGVLPFVTDVINYSPISEYSQRDAIIFPVF